MDILSDIWNRGLEQLYMRSDGPLYFRLYVMPVVAFLVGIRLGIRDAKKNEPTLLSNLITNSTERKLVLRPGWKKIFRILVIALVLDTIYQFMIFRAFYVFQAILVAVLCAFLPYMVGRGISHRLAGYFFKVRAAPEQSVNPENGDPE